MTSKLAGDSVEEVENTMSSDMSSIPDMWSGDHIKVKKKKAVNEMYQPDIGVLKSWIKKPHMKV